MPLGLVRNPELGSKSAFAGQLPVVAAAPDALGEGVGCGELHVGELEVAQRVNFSHRASIVHVELSELYVQIFHPGGLPSG